MMPSYVRNSESGRSTRTDKFVANYLAIENEVAKEAGTLAYMARAMVKATLPHSKPEGHVFQRTNGDFTMTMMGNPKFGLPYGSLPRLLLAWMTREAKIKKSPVLHLGKSFSAYLKTLKLSRGGGTRGDASRLKDQLLRLLSTQISCVYKNDEKGFCRSDQFLVTKSFQLWWSPLKDESIKQNSTIVLAGDFYEEIIHSPVPVDFRMLNALRRSPLQIDIYVWLTYRFSYLRKASLVTWNQLTNQFGANYANTAQGKRDFKREFIKSLCVVIAMYQDAKVDVQDGGLLLKPSKSHVASRTKQGEE